MLAQRYIFPVLLYLTVSSNILLSSLVRNQGWAHSLVFQYFDKIIPCEYPYQVKNQPTFETG